MKTITRDVVREFANSLITLKGSTTNLDVKNALRDRDYFAKQDQVREFMLDITSHDGKIGYVDSGEGYRIYAFKPDDAVEVPLVRASEVVDFLLGNIPMGVTTTNGLGQSVKPVPYGAKHTPGGSSIQYPTDVTIRLNRLHPDNIPADYRVYSVNDTTCEYLYRNMTRGQAKARWALESGKPYADARTEKLS